MQSGDQEGTRLSSPKTALGLVWAMAVPGGGAKKYLGSGYIVTPMGLGNGLDMPGKGGQARLTGPSS